MSISLWYYYCPVCCATYCDRAPGTLDYQWLFGRPYPCSSCGVSKRGEQPIVAFPAELQEACESLYRVGGSQALRQMAEDIVHRAQEEGAGRKALS